MWNHWMSLDSSWVKSSHRLTRLLCATLAAFTCLFAVSASGNSDSHADDSWTAYDVGTLEPGHRPRVALPVTFEIAPDCYLYVDYERVVDPVTLTLEEGTKLYLNDWLILGAPKRYQNGNEARQAYRDSWTEEKARRWLEKLGTLPAEQRLLDAGLSCREAVLAYHAECSRVERFAGEEYVRALEAGMDSSEAAQAAAAAAMAEDTLGIFSDIVVTRTGGVGSKYVGGGGFLPPTRVGPSTPPMSEEEKSARAQEKAISRATYLYEHLSGVSGSPCFILLRSRGNMQSSIGDELVSAALAQLAHARVDLTTYPEGPLDRYVVAGILKAEGLTVQW